MTNAAYQGEPRLPANGYPGLENLHGSIITDCGDDNARLRQEANFQNLFGVLPAFRNLGEHSPDLQAAGNLVDLLSATAPVGNFPASPLVVLVNVAPRGHEIRKRHKNGTPFGHVQVGNAHIFATVEGHALSLVERLGLASEVEVYDIPTVAEYLKDNKALSKREAKEVTETQFRSLETLPKIAYEIVTGSNLAYETQTIEPRPEVAGRVYEIDNFGNLKIAATPEDIGFNTDKRIKIVGAGAVRCVAPSPVILWSSLFREAKLQRNSAKK
jgi:hypothetical protein